MGEGKGRSWHGSRQAKRLRNSHAASGKVTAAEVAQKVFDAVASGQFYIYSHPQALGNVQQRMEAIVQGHNPPDPFAARPEVGQQLRTALRSA